MSAPLPFPDSPGGLHVIHRQWPLFLGLGIVLIVLGILAISAPFITGLAFVEFLAALFLIGGGVQIASAIFARGWRGFFLFMLVGILDLIVGLLMFKRPFEAQAGLGLLLAVAFLVGGISRIVVALTERFEGWVWALLNGVVSLLLGLFIWSGWPGTAVEFVGIYIGVNLLFAGWSWVMVGMVCRRLPTV